MTLFLRIWWITLFVRIILGVGVYVFPDETYYWFWSHHLQLSYFDHPPFLSWLLWLSHPFESIPGLFRVPVIFMSHASLLIWYQFLKNYLSENQQVLWLMLAVFNPLFGLGSIIATPDIPLVFFWSTSIYLILKIINGSKNNWDFVLLGASLGLGFCSKYNMVLFPLLILAWMILNKRNLFNIRTFGLMTITGIICCLPVLIWNYHNNFDSFLFQLRHGLGNNKTNWKLPLEYISGQLALLLPPLLFFAFKTAKKDFKNIFVLLGWGPLLFFLISSFRGRVEANWPLVAYPAIMMLAVNYESKWLKYSYRLWIVALLLVVPFIFLKKEIPFLKLDKLKEIYELQMAARISTKYQPLYGANYQTSSYLSYLNKKDVYKLRDMSRRDFYDYLSESMPTEKTFYLITKYHMELPQWAKELKQENVEVLEPYVFVKLTREP